MELFANLGLQGYVLDVEPDQQKSLETLFEVVWDHAALPHKLHALHDMAAAMMSDALNYVWFGVRATVAGRRLWRTAGVTALRALRDRGLHVLLRRLLALARATPQPADQEDQQHARNRRRDLDLVRDCRTELGRSDSRQCPDRWQ